MRIAISLLNFRPGKIGGTETYIRELIPGLAKEKGNDTLVIVTFRDNAREICVDGVETAVVDRSDREMILARCLEAFTPYRARFAEKVFEEIAPDVVLFPQQSIFPKRMRFPAVLTAHDLQHLFFPHNFSLFDRAFRRATYPASLKRANRIIAISEFTKQTLIDRCGAESNRIIAIPHGFTLKDCSHSDQTFDLPRPYLYYPASTLPHKNHRTLFETIAALRKRGDFDYKLILSGIQSSHWKSLEREIHRLDLGETVIHRGFVPYAEVWKLYQNAEAIVFPTRFEGFGLPVLEAASMEKKVITSQIEVFREIGVPEPYRIDFSNPDELLDALHATDPTRLEREPSTWIQCARRTHEVLHSAAEASV